MIAKTIRKRRRSGRGAIMLISGLLLSSAAIRMGAGAGQAFATESALLSGTLQDTKGGEHEGRKTTAGHEELSPLLKAFQDREARIAERESQIEVRLKALAVADQQIELRMTNLRDAEEALRATLALADSAAEDDLSRLTSVYENMKPKDAAALFEEMEPAFAAGFLGRMRPESAAGVMAGLSPQAAYSISVILAGRNAKAPKS